jgi:L-lysine 2,3-aminomutase
MKLMHELLKARVRPYYIYMADQVAAGETYGIGEDVMADVLKGVRGDR